MGAHVSGQTAQRAQGDGSGAQAAAGIAESPAAAGCSRRSFFGGVTGALATTFATGGPGGVGSVAGLPGRDHQYDDGLAEPFYAAIERYCNAQAELANATRLRPAPLKSDPTLIGIFRQVAQRDNFRADVEEALRALMSGKDAPVLAWEVDLAVDKTISLRMERFQAALRGVDEASVELLQFGPESLELARATASRWMPLQLPTQPSAMKKVFNFQLQREAQQFLTSISASSGNKLHRHSNGTLSDKPEPLPDPLPPEAWMYRRKGVQGWPRYSLEHFCNLGVRALLQHELIPALNVTVLSCNARADLQQLPELSWKISQTIHPNTFQAGAPAAAGVNETEAKAKALLEILEQHQHEAGQLSDRNHPLRGLLSDPISQLAVAVFTPCQDRPGGQHKLTFPFEKLSKDYSDYFSGQVNRSADQNDINKNFLLGAVSRGVTELADKSELFLGGFPIRNLEQFKKAAQCFHLTPQFAVTFLMVLDRGAQSISQEQLASLLKRAGVDTIVDLYKQTTW